MVSNAQLLDEPEENPIVFILRSNEYKEKMKIRWSAIYNYRMMIGKVRTRCMLYIGIELMRGRAKNTMSSNLKALTECDKKARIYT